MIRIIIFAILVASPAQAQFFGDRPPITKPNVNPTPQQHLAVEQMKLREEQRKEQLRIRLQKRCKIVACGAA